MGVLWIRTTGRCLNFGHVGVSYFDRINLSSRNVWWRKKIPRWFLARERKKNRGISVKWWKKGEESTHSFRSEIRESSWAEKENMRREVPSPKPLSLSLPRTKIRFRGELMCISPPRSKTSIPVFESSSFLLHVRLSSHSIANDFFRIIYLIFSL